MKEISPSVLMEKRLILQTPQKCPMGWLVRIRDEWYSAGIITRIAWIFTIVWPIATTLKEVWNMPAFDFYSFLNILLYFVLVAVIIQNMKLTRQLRNRELEDLVKPLYLAFDKYPKGNLINQLSTPPDPRYSPKNNVSALKELAEDANSVIEIMREHRELAKSQLQELIDKYLEMRRSYSEQRPPYGPDSIVRYYPDAQRILKEIVDLIKTRYDELTKAK